MRARRKQAKHTYQFKRRARESVVKGVPSADAGASDSDSDSNGYDSDKEDAGGNGPVSTTSRVVRFKSTDRRPTRRSSTTGTTPSAVVLSSNANGSTGGGSAASQSLAGDTPAPSSSLVQRHFSTVELELQGRAVPLALVTMYALTIERCLPCRNPALPFTMPGSSVSVVADGECSGLVGVGDGRVEASESRQRAASTDGALFPAVDAGIGGASTGNATDGVQAGAASRRSSVVADRAASVSDSKMDEGKSSEVGADAARGVIRNNVGAGTGDNGNVGHDGSGTDVDGAYDGRRRAGGESTTASQEFKEAVEAGDDGDSIEALLRMATAAIEIPDAEGSGSSAP